MMQFLSRLGRFLARHSAIVGALVGLAISLLGLGGSIRRNQAIAVEIGNAYLQGIIAGVAIPAAAFLGYLIGRDDVRARIRRRLKRIRNVDDIEDQDADWN